MWNTPMNKTTKLTLELRDLVDNGVDIWDFEYPSYYTGDEKKKFEEKVNDHYYFRQIGFETVGRFKHALRTKMNEIMPYYLKLYKSVEIMDAIEDPFGNVDVTETFEETLSGTTSGTTTNTGESSASTTNTGESSGTTTDTNTTTGSGTNTETTTNEGEKKFSNTPQGSIANIDKYITEATTEDSSNTKSSSFENETSTNGSSSTESSSSDTSSSESSSSGSSTTESSNTETRKHTYTKKGNQGVNTYAHDMVEFRQSIIDVDMMIIADLNCLFLGVY